MADGSDERDKIDRWLASTGFPLEYAAVRTLERAGLRADAGLYYRPVDGGPPREVDVVARTNGHRDRLPISVRLVIECKFAVTPWVVLTRDTPVALPDLLGWTTATSEARAILVSRARASQEGVPLWFLATPEPHGVNIIAMPPPAKVAGGGRSPYEAMTQVVDAARGILSETPPSNPESPYGTETAQPLAVAWPVLVVRGGLYQARMAEEGDLKSEPIQWQRVIWGGSTGQPTVLDVVSEPYLDAYGRLAHEGMERMESALDSGKAT